MPFHCLLSMSDHIGCVCKNFHLKISMHSLTWSDGTNLQCSYVKDEGNGMLEYHNKSSRRQQFSQSTTTHNPFRKWDGFLQNDVHVK